MEVASYSATERNFVMSLVVDMGAVTIDDTWLTDVLLEVCVSPQPRSYAANQIFSGDYRSRQDVWSSLPTHQTTIFQPGH